MTNVIGRIIRVTAKDPELGHATAIHQEPQFEVLKNFPQTLHTGLRTF